ncbi:MOSC domain-containing protein [Methanobacterium formicicum]|jgi:MOSC domain-containing protein YiiM|uniref:MOSC domain-containing protein n=1 Tax=Methanobacterium formicicum TaxID=2162 RepID=UPI0024127BD1|nr:MOSC domain-containing protein [Methanobacterium formicicum]MDG3547442.1 MOSC domain-containing protein [Methanobacterium formicicum]
MITDRLTMNNTNKTESGRIVAVCTSPQKQTRKINIQEGVVKENHGLMGDAHSSSLTHRQVSLLAQESIDKMKDLGLDVHPGDFAENITTIGIELVTIPLGSRIQVGNETILEVTQIGKKCHNRCAIYQQAGDCIMPREGIFARAITGGKVKTGDKIRIL